jgi:hypothetical protein
MALLRNADYIQVNLKLDQDQLVATAVHQRSG